MGSLYLLHIVFNVKYLKHLKFNDMMKKIYLLMVFVSLGFLGFGQLTESFESGLPGSYNATLSNATLGSGVWQIANVIAGTTGVNSGTKSAQIRSATAAQIITPTLVGGVSSISFYVTASTTSGAYQVNISTNDGSSFSPAPGSPFTISTTKTFKTITINDVNVNKIQIYRTGATIYIDDVTITSAATGPADPTAFTIANTTSTQIGLSWTNAASTDGVWVVAREGAAPDIDITDGEGVYNFDGITSTGNFSTATDLVDDEGYTGTTGNILVYSGTGSSCVVSGLTEGNDYYFTIFNEYGTADWSDGAQSSPTNDIAEVQGTSSFAAAAGNTQAVLSWTNPSGQGSYWDQVLILAKSGGAVDATPSGAGSGYTADAAFGSGDEVGTDNFVVYSGTGTSETITSLVNGTTYYFKTFVYDGSDWTPVGQTETGNCTPNNIVEPSPGDLIITEISGTTVDNGDGFMEVYNTSDNTISLENVQLRYWNSNPSAATPSPAVDLSGVIASHDFIILARSSSNFNSEYGFLPDYSDAAFYFNGGDDGCDIYYTSSSLILDAFNDNGTTASGHAAWTWTDGSSWDRNSTASGAIQANWEQNDVSTPKSIGYEKWNGSSSNVWATDENWIFGAPAATTNVEIPASLGTYPTISGSTVAINQLTIGNAAELTVATDGNLTVNGDYLGGGATLLIESDASGDGSVIIYGNMGGPMDIERYITPYSVADDGWHLLSSPRTASFDLSLSDFVPTEGDDDVYNWNEVSYEWENYFGVANPGFNFDPGYGYLVAYKTQSTVKKFSGYVNNQNITVGSLSLTDNNADLTLDGWNLLGNPFSSAIKWNDGNWTLSNINATAKVYNEAGGNYVDRGSDDIIPMNQGFFVQVNDLAGGSVTIPLASRVHNSTAWYKNTEETEANQTLELKVSGGTNSFYDIAKVKFDGNATDEFDFEFDSHKLRGMASAPQLFTQQGTEEFSTNTLAFQQNEKLLPLSFIAGTNGTFTIEVQQNTVSSEGKTYLEDLALNQMIDLSSQTSYAFQATTTDSPNRFLLHFNGVTAVDELEAQGPAVYSVNNEIYISSLEAMDAQILVYNINGQLVGQAQMNNETMKHFTVEATKGVYMVSVQAENVVYTEKVYIK